MENYSDFEKLFLVNDIDGFLEDYSPIVRAKSIASILHNYCFIKCNGKIETLYIRMKNGTYTAEKSVERYLLTIICTFFTQSLVEIQKDNDDFRKLTKKYGDDEVFNIRGNASIRSYLPQLISVLTKNNIVLDTTIGEIHFENGYINTTTGKFHQRNNSHFVSKYIKRKYTKATNEDIKSMMKLYSQIYPDETDRNLVLGNLSIALSWKAPQNQTSLFLIGTGSAGKSFVLETLQATMGPYFQKLKNDTFSNDKDRNKVLNTFYNNPQSLFIWINEFDDKKMTTSVYKDMCDGNIDTVRLYEDGNHSFKHNGYVAATGNKLPNMITDTGTKRRIRSYTHVSHFTDKIEDVDESNNIYLKDEELLEKIIPFYDAIVDIFVGYCVKWNKNKNIYDTSKSENFQSSIDLINSSNDTMQDFIDSRLVITKTQSDKIGKDKMRSLYLQMYPDKHISTLQIISELKDRKLIYNKDARDNHVKGCFVGVKERTDDIIDEVDPLSGEPPKDENEIKLEQQAKQIEELMQKLKQLEEDNEKLKSVVKMKTVLESEPTAPVIVAENEVEPQSEELSTASEAEPEEEEVSLIEPPKKLKVIRKKTPVKKSKFNEEAEQFAQTFKAQKEEYIKIEDDTDAVANVFF